MSNTPNVDPRRDAGYAKPEKIPVHRAKQAPARKIKLATRDPRRSGG